MQFMIKGYVGAEFYPVADIEKMQHAWKDMRGGKHPATILFKDGREIQVNDTEINRIVRQSTPVIPALSGFELLTIGYEVEDDEEGGPWVSREPIIGWRDAQYGGLEPVVVDHDVTDLEDRHAIPQPDGRVQTGDRWFDCVDDWSSDYKAAKDAEYAVKQQASGAAGQVGGVGGS